MTKYIDVPVPEHLVPDVMEFITERLRNPSQRSMVAVQEAHSEADLTERVWRESLEPHKRLLLNLARHAEEARTFEAVSADLGLPSPRSLPGMLGAFGRRSKHRYGGFKPFEAEHRTSKGGWVLWMRDDAAAIVLRLAADEGLLANEDHG